ncbi:hypothetical protein CR513_45634, partial [Mucuna pruriens]
MPSMALQIKSPNLYLFNQVTQILTKSINALPLTDIFYSLKTSFSRNTNFLIQTYFNNNSAFIIITFNYSTNLNSSSTSA